MWSKLCGKNKINRPSKVYEDLENAFKAFDDLL
jgi:hypothetical protein